MLFCGHATRTRDTFLKRTPEQLKGEGVFGGGKKKAKIMTYEDLTPKPFSIICHKEISQLY
jgi:hypothetical protein